MSSGLYRLGRDELMVSVRPAMIEDAPQIARVHVDSWRSTYSGIIPEDFLVAMSYEDFEARWRGWLGGEFGAHGAFFYVAELVEEGTVGFASGGPRQEQSNYPGYEGELYTAYLLRQHQRRRLGCRLLGAVARGLLADGKRSMLAWVLAKNPSRPFYEAVGGKPLGGQKVEIGGAALKEVVYGWNDIRSLATPT